MAWLLILMSGVVYHIANDSLSMSSPSIKKYLWQKSLELVNQTGKSKWPDYQGPRSTIHSYMKTI